jgi:hypothetical protein
LGIEREGGREEVKGEGGPHDLAVTGVLLKPTQHKKVDKEKTKNRGGEGEGE